MTHLAKMTRGSVLLVAVLAGAVGGFTVRGERPVAAQGRAWTMRTFMISHWGFPKDEQQRKRFAQSGFNTVIAVPEQLPACRKYGWQALLAVPADKAAAYVDAPIVWGYHLFDEPALKNVRYEGLAEKMKAFHKLDPARPAYINLNELDDPEVFIKILKPRVLSYDYYQWWAKREPFFPLLEKFRRAALGANIPLICWVEAVVVPGGPIPDDNEAKIRHSVYSALAYGAKGIQWWAWRPYNSDAEKINAELKVLGPVLVKLCSVDVFHTPPIPKQTRALPEQSWIQSPTERLILGLFKNEQGDDFLLAANRDSKAARNAVLMFPRSVASVRMLDRRTGKWVKRPLAQRGELQWLTHNLAPGDGVLLRVKRQRPKAAVTPEEICIAENFLLYQRDNGGWRKNYKGTRKLSDNDKQEILKQKRLRDTTFDNGATHTEIRHLAKVYSATQDTRYKQAILRGVEFMLKAKYANGGWPQFYPKARGYNHYITFNDGAMIGVMALLRDIAQDRVAYPFVEADLRRRCAEAVNKGLACVLRCQIVVGGKKTAWCAQHDHRTLKPARARSYELASISGFESVAVIEYLMEIDKPSPEVIDAIQSAVAWFDRAKLRGIKVVRKEDKTAPRGFDYIVTKDASAPPMWARFYKIGTDQPIFCSRDGIPKKTLAEISAERRTGYTWLGYFATDLLGKHYPAWQKKWAPHNNVLKRR